MTTEMVVTLTKGQAMYLRALLSTIDIMTDMVNKDMNYAIQLELEDAKEVPPREQQSQQTNVVPIIGPT